jgi:hypothetical protein
MEAAGGSALPAERLENRGRLVTGCVEGDRGLGMPGEGGDDAGQRRVGDGNQEQILVLGAEALDLRGVATQPGRQLLHRRLGTAGDVDQGPSQLGQP